MEEQAEAAVVVLLLFDHHIIPLIQFLLLPVAEVVAQMEAALIELG
jgi:hypothetical protein